MLEKVMITAGLTILKNTLLMVIAPSKQQLLSIALFRFKPDSWNTRIDPTPKVAVTALVTISDK